LYRLNLAAEIPPINVLRMIFLESICLSERSLTLYHQRLFPAKTFTGFCRWLFLH